MAYAEASFAGTTSAAASSLVVGGFFDFGTWGADSFLALQTYDKRCYQDTFVRHSNFVQQAENYLRVSW